LVRQAFYFFSENTPLRWGDLTGRTTLPAREFIMANEHTGRPKRYAWMRTWLGMNANALSWTALLVGLLLIGAASGFR